MFFTKIKLKWKVFAFLLGFCALLLIILWLFQTVFLDDFYKMIRVREIERAATTIIDSIGDDDIIGIIEDISNNSDITVDITDMNGRSRLWLFPPQDRRATEMNLAFISLARENDGVFLQYTTLAVTNPRYGVFPGGRATVQSLIYAKVSDDTPEGGIAVIINAVISPVNATVTTLRYQLYFVSGIMMLLAVLLAMIIAKRVSKPIEIINRSAQTLAKGDYSTRFSGKGFNEIVELSETLNTAAIELGKVENLRRELLANVSHDLRTPLSLIYGYAEMMNDFPGEISKEQTKVIMDETMRLTTLVNDVLDISKLESEMESLAISSFNITKNILDTTCRVEELLKNDGYRILFERDSDVYVYADEIKISRAFYNLLINAVNYSGHERVILVSQAEHHNSVIISVTDNGAGIEEKDLGHIWDRYYKSGGAHTRAVMGTGLGLSIVKKVMELHGGRYGVSSEPGKGSTFWFELNKSVG